MTIKELFKLLESANELNTILGNKKSYISLEDDGIFSLRDKDDNKRFYTFKEFRKAVKDSYVKDCVEDILNSKFEQETQYNNYFTFDHYEIGIFED